MPRKFDIPLIYRSQIISKIKEIRKQNDHYKKDLSPSVLNLGPLTIKLARHFGFCFGVENAIEIAYRALEENPDKRVFLLSEMIHNPNVNADLIRCGIRFIQKTDGSRLLDLDSLRSDDIVIIPAFGCTRELFQIIEDKGIQTKKYNTTCPFVERVWNRAQQLGSQGYTIIIHGYEKHEETRATFSHASQNAPTLMVRNMEEIYILADFIHGKRPSEEFYEYFQNRYSSNFFPEKDLQKLGIINQTTMLATETQAISNYLRDTMQKKASNTENETKDYFADTRDTLCYATNENQEAIHHLLKSGGDLAIVVGGYNSSNTSHLVELMKKQLPVYYIKDASEIINSKEISHLNLTDKKVIRNKHWQPLYGTLEHPLQILLSAGASCPDALVNDVIVRLAELYKMDSSHINIALNKFEELMTIPNSHNSPNKCRT